MDFNKKIILITGGSSGIGLAAAIEFAKNGAEIIIQARGQEKLLKAKEDILKFGEKVHAFPTDLTSPEEVVRVRDLIIDEIGLPDIIINSAGAGEWLSLKEAEIGHFKETIESPYLATAYTIKAFYDKMIERNHGHFIIINSAAAYFSFPKATGYTASRWAMLGLSKSLQADLYASNINISMIAFGKVDSPYFKNNPLSEDRIPRITKLLIPTVSTDYCGKQLLKLAKTKKKMIVKPFMMSLLVWKNRFFPGLFRWIIRVSS